MLNRFTAQLIVLFVLIPAASRSSGLPLIQMPGLPVAPALQLQGLDGEAYDLAAYKGRVVVLNFWATWCPPCRKELPALNRAWQRLKKDDVVFLSVNLGAKQTLLEGFLERIPVSYPVLLDTEMSNYGPWQLQGLPTTYVIGPDGKIAYGAIGDRDWDNEKILRPIRDLAR